MRTIAVVTVGRSDFGILRPVLRSIARDPDLKLSLIVAGMHLDARWGRTIDEIESEGFTVTHRLECAPEEDAPHGIACAIGRGIAGFSAVFEKDAPDILALMGDRYEMFAAGVAATPFNIPMAHIHGGELTFGAFDDALRHSLTKLSHLHFTSTEESARRVIQLGEEPWRVVVSGAPGLDNLAEMKLPTFIELQDEWGVKFDRFPLLVTFHPATREYRDTEYQITELLAVLDERPEPIVFTMPNADTNGTVIRRAILRFCAAHSRAVWIENLGTRRYFSLMAHAAAMVGNSSSGIIEAASFGLPVVNIGTRQAGRLRGGNVIDVGYSREEIAAGISQATDPAFRAGLRGMKNPYGNGGAAGIIVNRLKSVLLNQQLICKRFYEINVAINTEEEQVACADA